MMRIALLICLILAFPLTATAQDPDTCDPSAIAASYARELGSSRTLEEISDLSGRLALELATCRNAGTEVGSLRSNPAPAYAALQVTDAFSIYIGNYADITDWVLENFPDNVVEGKTYYGIAFIYGCTLSVDETCEDSLSMLSAVGQSGNVYDYETLYGAGLEFSWEVFGGGNKELFTVFAIDEADAENFLIRVTSHTPDYQERVKFFTLGNLVVPEE